ncbi:MAG TPA: lamin tail domain-containing protein, partial [Phycisphaerales bacterium]|nr:lamin tail domain-containing protein [Phycisphaerales bacterium]
MRVFSAVLAIGASVLAGGAASAQTVFCQWDFDAVGPVGPVDDNTGLPTDAPYFTSGLIYNTPAPTIGNGSCIPLGMDNLDSGPPDHTGTYVFGPYSGQYVYGSVAYCDVSPQSGLAHGGSTYSITCWRVRGPNNSYVAPGINNGNGWNRSAPERSQGAQFSTSTVGYSNIRFQCQISCSTQSVSCAQAQYTLDGTTWLDFGGPIYMASNDFIQPASGPISSANFGINLDFTPITGANNNPNFGVRIVSIYDPRFPGTAQVPAPNYAAAANPTTTPYNNSSGNWRYGLMTFSGTPTGPINPVLRASTDKIAVCASEDNTIIFQALVQPGVNPASTGTTVYADLSSIGLSGHQVLAGNQAGTFFSYTGTVPAGTVVVPTGQTTPITRTVTFTVTDDQGRSISSGSAISFVNCSGVDSGKPVVISQVYGGGGNTDSINAANQGVYDSDFVEIYNRSASPVDLTGWSVQYASPASSGGFNNSNNQVNLSGTIQPRQYMLIRFSDPVYGFQPLPTPDFSTRYGYGGIGNTGGRVVLSNSTALVGTGYTAAAVQDLVGFGAAAVTFEGAGPAATPDNSHAVIRKATTLDPNPGAQDSNQNFYDFSPSTPLPHNRANNGTDTFLTAYASIPHDDANKVVVTNSACAGSQVLFTVAVTPGTSSTGISVMGDISPITGSPGMITLYDDGPAGGHGDLGAGDGVYSFLYTIPANAAQGFRTISFTASDA